VKKEKGRIDFLFASAGTGEFAAIGEVTKEHFDKISGVNIRGTLFTAQKAESYASSHQPRFCRTDARKPTTSPDTGRM